MSSYSKTIVCGNLGNDPEIRYAGNGSAVVNLSIATSERFKDKQTGQQQERTEWHRVVFFGKPAEVIAQHCQKGAKLLVEGQNRTRSYEKDGVTRYTTEIVGRDFTFMGKAPGSEQGGQQHQPQRQASSPAQQPQQAAGNFDDFDDDIPF